MQRINIDPEKYAATVTARKRKGVNHDYQLLGEEIEQFFMLHVQLVREAGETEEAYQKREADRKKARKALWVSFWMIPDWKHRQALKVCQQKGVGSIRYFWGVIKNIV